MVVLLGMLACGNSGLARQDPEASPDTDSATPGAVAECRFEGSWELQQISCTRAFPLDDWFLAYDTATLSVVAAEGGGCDVVRESRSNRCREVETMRWTELESGSVQVASEGITLCDPAGCSFDEVGVCEPSARSNTTDLLQVTLDTQSDTLSVTDGQPEGTMVSGAPGCTEEVVTVWARR